MSRIYIRKVLSSRAEPLWLGTCGALLTGYASAHPYVFPTPQGIIGLLIPERSVSCSEVTSTLQQLSEQNSHQQCHILSSGTVRPHLLCGLARSLWGYLHKVSPPPINFLPPSSSYAVPFTQHVVLGWDSCAPGHT